MSPINTLAKCRLKPQPLRQETKKHESLFGEGGDEVYGLWGGVWEGGFGWGEGGSTGTYGCIEAYGTNTRVTNMRP
jgi:hypothetical protein